MSVTTFQLFPLTLRLKVVPRRRRWRGKKLIRFREDGETKGGSVARLSVYGGQRAGYPCSFSASFLWVPSEHFLRTPRLQRIKKETVQTLLETRAIRKPFFSPSLPFLRDSFGAKRNFSIWNLNRCMCRVSLKWWPETEGGKLNWKELEIGFISKNVYLYVAIMLFCRSETCAKFHFCGKNGNWKKVNRERS